MDVAYVDHMGNDLSVVNAARVSFAKIKDDFDANDERLVNYLAKHDHWTPFAHTAVTLRVSAPIPIRTQCFKHKVGLVENEESRRYISVRPELYTPSEFRNRPDGSIKQGSDGKHERSASWRIDYHELATQCIDLYESMIADGVCPEQARFILPQGCEVNWMWTGNLMAFANFYNKRTDPHAQEEIQHLARLVGATVEQLFPISWKALTNG